MRKMFRSHFLPSMQVPHRRTQKWNILLQFSPPCIALSQLDPVSRNIAFVWYILVYRSHAIRPSIIQTPFVCEWQGCGKAFRVPKEVELHAIAAHCPLGADDIPCLWQRCDGMRRKRFSLMTHIQDRHCHPQVRRQLPSGSRNEMQEYVQFFL